MIQGSGGLDKSNDIDLNLDSILSDDNNNKSDNIFSLNNEPALREPTPAPTKTFEEIQKEKAEYIKDYRTGLQNLKKFTRTKNSQWIQIIKKLNQNLKDS